MRIIQTCWSCKNDDLLTFSGGWAAPEYHIMGWTLSCLLLKKYYPELVLYTDSAAAKILIDTLHLPYTDVVCELDGLSTYHKGLWALPKVDTYSRQDRPFLHVDGDVFIWAPFDKQLLDQGLIAQNKEVSTGYSEKAMSMLESSLSWFPDEILEERRRQEKIYNYNAGILGGNDLSFFAEFSEKGKYLVDRNIGQLSASTVPHFNIIYEQYLFYCLTKKYDKTVTLLFQELHNDHGYKGFADFSDVPYDRQYLHLMGAFKRDLEICTQMAARLRKEYPSYYYRIIQLFKDRKVSLRRDYYSPPKPFMGWRTNYVDLFTRYDPDAVKLGEGVSERLQQEVRKLEQEIALTLQGKFCDLTKDWLYKRDTESSGYCEDVFGVEIAIGEKQLKTAGLFEIVASPFDWTLLNDRIAPALPLFEDLAASEQEPHYLAIIPEAFTEGYSIMSLSGLDRLILEVLKEAQPISALLQEVAKVFDPAELENAWPQFQSLIYDRIKIFLQRKLIQPIVDLKN